MIKQWDTFLCFAVICLFTLGGCGIKPDELSPPEGSEETAFPRTYPDPANDPEPVSKY